MVKLTTFIFAALTVLAAAENCQTTLIYCGDDLLRKGNYYTQIVDALISADQPTDTEHIYSSLFYCKGGDNGDISFQTFCDGACVDGGSNHNDYCN